MWPPGASQPCPWALGFEGMENRSLGSRHPTVCVGLRLKQKRVGSRARRPGFRSHFHLLRCVTSDKLPNPLGLSVLMCMGTVRVPSL